MAGSLVVPEMRREDWPSRLAAFVEAKRAAPFGWGSHDCVTMAAAWIEEATGIDPVADIRGWDDALSAARTIEALGGLRQAVTDRLGPEIGPAFAQRGDIVLHEETERPGLGVCVGELFAAPLDEGGVVLVPMDRAVCAWRV